MFEVYCYLDPTAPGRYMYDELCFLYKPIYIGKGKVSDKRKLKHLSKCSNIHLERKIRQLSKLSLIPIIFTIQKFDDEGDSLLCETHLIKMIGRNDIKLGPLYNFTDGGEGRCGIKLTKKQLQQKSINHKRWWASLSQEERSEISKKSHETLRNNPEKFKSTIEKIKNTKSNFSRYKKKNIELKRFKKWKATVEKRGDDLKQRLYDHNKNISKLPRKGKIYHTLQNTKTKESICMKQYEWFNIYGIDSTVLKSRQLGVCLRTVKSTKTGDEFIYLSTETRA